QHDLLHNDGSSTAGDGNAPCAMQGVNGGRVAAIDGVVSAGVADCIADLLAADGYPQVPSAPDGAAAQAAPVPRSPNNPSAAAPCPCSCAPCSARRAISGTTVSARAPSRTIPPPSAWTRSPRTTRPVPRPAPPPWASSPSPPTRPAPPRSPISSSTPCEMSP